MKMWWRGPTRGNGILGYQRSQNLVDPIYGWRVMSSCKSHENAIQGHLVTLGLGAKNQTKQKNCMTFAPANINGKGQHGNPTNTGMVEGFAELTHQCERFIEGN